MKAGKPNFVKKFVSQCSFPRSYFYWRWFIWFLRLVVMLVVMLVVIWVVICTLPLTLPLALPFTKARCPVFQGSSGLPYFAKPGRFTPDPALPTSYNWLNGRPGSGAACKAGLLMLFWATGFLFYYVSGNVYYVYNVYYFDKFTMF